MKKQQRKVSRVRVMKISASPFEKKINLIGMAKAKEEVVVSAEEGGVINKILFDKGDRVKKGTLLLRLDESTLKASLAEVEAVFKLEKFNYDKLKILKKGGGAVSEFDLENARLKSSAAAARADVMRARFGKLQIMSPIDGIVDQKLAEIGELVRPGTAVAKIINIEQIKVQAGIAEKDVRFVTRRSQAQLVFDAYGDTIFTAKVDYIATTADPSNGTFMIEIPLSNKNKLIKPGMFARIMLTKESCKACILVPQDSIIEHPTGKAIFIVDAKGEAKLQRVTPGETEGDRVVIEKGINEGDTIVIVGQRNLADGEKVQVVE
ncbi:MAG: efflux RND transporter periplasmic adaptor subunit [Proteobacteria bacterium]|nr:efflux RND transporter periplasmic adaptor subunit [Pseudomonadota bacterium]